MWLSEPPSRMVGILQWHSMSCQIQNTDRLMLQPTYGLALLQFASVWVIVDNWLIHGQHFQLSFHSLYTSKQIDEIESQHTVWLSSCQYCSSFLYSPCAMAVQTQIGSKFVCWTHKPPRLLNLSSVVYVHLSLYDKMCCLHLNRLETYYMEHNNGDER
jgi:hypothetical protein